MKKQEQKLKFKQEQRQRQKQKNKEKIKTIDFGNGEERKYKKDSIQLRYHIKGMWYHLGDDVTYLKDHIETCFAEFSTIGLKEDNEKCRKIIINYLKIIYGKRLVCIIFEEFDSGVKYKSFILHKDLAGIIKGRKNRIKK